MTQEIVVKLAVSAAPYQIDKPFSYRVPARLRDSVQRGKRVIAPFGRGNKKCEGLILSVVPDTGVDKLKYIESVIDESPVLDEEHIKLALFMHERFFCSVFSAVRAMLPVGMWFRNGERQVGDASVSMAYLNIPSEEAKIIAAQKRLKSPHQADVLDMLSELGEASVKEIAYYTGAGRDILKRLEKQELITLGEVETFRRPEIKIAPKKDFILNDEQNEAFEGLKKLLSSEKAEAALLYGVTGSGKTSVYIRLIEETIGQGKTAIVLVPEIALTPQVMSIFMSQFGDRVAVLHSALSMGERYDEWKRIRSGAVDLVVGTRSAIFAPLENIGVIILDEEQEGTYKSENSPRYHARDVAKFRCVFHNALLVLGSATPSVESMYSAKNGKYALFELKNRYNQSALPPVIISDMKEALRSGKSELIGDTLFEELSRNIEQGEQSILFINRRGTSPLVTCGKCGYIFKCPRCGIATTYHAANNRLLCHYCGYSEPVPALCPECYGELKFVGAGTQKIEDELSKLFPDTAMIRMDTDTVTEKNSHDKLLSKFRDEKVPILLGTQMVTKGLDFENVTLVGVISADQMLYLNDFRAHERTFSLITQVVGRSGRGEKPGRAVIQTFTPENEVIRLASMQDYDGFYEREIELRRLSGNPPVKELFCITASGIDEHLVMESCAKLRATLLSYLADETGVQVFRQTPAPIPKINNRFRYRVLLSGANTKRVRDTIAHSVRELMSDSKYRGVSVYADMNPYE